MGLRELSGGIALAAISAPGFAAPDRQAAAARHPVTPSRRGGATDELALLKDAGKAGQAKSIYEARLDALVVGGLPEPAAWTTMIAGFGAAGARLRRAKKARVAGARPA